MLKSKNIVLQYSSTAFGCFHLFNFVFNSVAILIFKNKWAKKQINRLWITDLGSPFETFIAHMFFFKSTIFTQWLRNLGKIKYSWVISMYWASDFDEILTTSSKWSVGLCRLTSSFDEWSVGPFWRRSLCMPPYGLWMPSLVAKRI